MLLNRVRKFPVYGIKIAVMSTISGKSDLSVNAPKRMCRRFGMAGWVLILGFIFVSENAFSQDKKDKPDPKKSLHEIAVKLYEHTATEG